jgi:hypothetical protein
MRFIVVAIALAFALVVSAEEILGLVREAQPEPSRCRALQCTPATQQRGGTGVAWTSSRVLGHLGEPPVPVWRAMKMSELTDANP